MSLVFLLDEHISPVVAEQIRKMHPEIHIESIMTWRGGYYRNTSDEQILSITKEAGVVLVTYDRSTIFPLLKRLGERNVAHGGVIFVSQGTISSRDVGALIKGLVALWNATYTEDWSNRVVFLSPASK